MMFVLATILFLLFLTIGIGCVAIGLAMYLFVWTANGKHTLTPALIFGSAVVFGLFTVWMACINYIQVL